MESGIFDHIINVISVKSMPTNDNLVACLNSDPTDGMNSVMSISLDNLDSIGTLFKILLILLLSSFVWLLLYRYLASDCSVTANNNVPATIGKDEKARLSPIEEVS